MKYPISLENYNIDKLEAELSAVTGYLGTYVRDTELYVILESDTVIPEIDAILLSHDPSPTVEQVAQGELEALASNKVLYVPFMSLVRQWRDAYEASIIGNESLEQAYTRYRAIWEGATPQQQKVIRRHGRQVGVDMAEPTTVTDAYRGQFNQVLMSFMMLVYLRVKS